MYFYVNILSAVIDRDDLHTRTKKVRRINKCYDKYIWYTVNVYDVIAIFYCTVSCTRRGYLYGYFDLFIGTHKTTNVCLECNLMCNSINFILVAIAYY